MSYRTLPNPSDNQRGWSQKATLARTEELTKLGKTKGKEKIVDVLLAKDRASARAAQQTTAAAQAARGAAFQTQALSLAPALSSGKISTIVDLLNNQSTPTNFGNGKVGKLASKLSNADNIRQWTNVVNKWFPGLTNPQYHHDEPRRSRDISFIAGESPREIKMLTLLVRAIEKAYGIQLGGGAYGGHRNHLHIEFLSGKNLIPSEVIFDPIGYYFHNNKN